MSENIPLLATILATHAGLSSGVSALVIALVTLVALLITAVFTRRKQELGVASTDASDVRAAKTANRYRALTAGVANIPGRLALERDNQPSGMPVGVDVSAARVAASEAAAKGVPVGETLEELGQLSVDLRPSTSRIEPQQVHDLRLSVVIPAQNEEGAVRGTVETLVHTLTAAAIPFEILVVNDHSSDSTETILRQLTTELPGVRYINNERAKGFGRAIQSGLESFQGDAVCIVMADASDDARDVVTYYRKLREGYECVFGSRFMSGSRVVDYPTHKLLVNRLANAFIKHLFHLRLNDTTNAFKAYRREVIFGISPIVSPHFNITVELPLKAISRGYSYTIVPINWYNRKTGVSKLKIKEMGSRYLFIVLIVWLEQKLARGDYRRITVPADDTATHEVQAAVVNDTVSVARLLASTARLAIFAVPAALLSLILWGIWNLTPHVPFWDEWQNIDMVLHYQQGKLQFADFWAFHNEHRIVIPRMLDLALIVLTKWNEQVLMTFDLGLAVAEAALLLGAVRCGLRSTRWMFALVVPVSLLVFSLGQYENWLWAFQITFICTVFGVACCVYGFARQPASWVAFLLALAGALIASWSSVGGTMVWIAFLPAAWRAGRSKSIVWIVVAVGVLVTYFQGFPHQVPIHVSLSMLGFALGYLGTPLGYLSASRIHVSAVVSVAIGAASVMFVLANLAIFWRTRHWHADRDAVSLDAWFGLALFALAVDGITTLGRYSLFGFNDLLTSRYQIFSVLWWVAVVVLAAINVKGLAAMSRVAGTASPAESDANSSADATAVPNRAGRWMMALRAGNVAVMVAACLALLLSNAAAWGSLTNYVYAQRLDEACVANYQSAPNVCLRGFVWDATYLRQEAAILDQYHLSIFANNVESTRPLVAYVNERTGDHWATTALVDTHSSGYSNEAWLGLLFVNARDGTRALYQCMSATTHTHFLSLSDNCDGQVRDSVEGWLYLNPPSSGTNASPLYRCQYRTSKISFVSTNAGCDGEQVDVLLGYILTQTYPWGG